MEAMLKRALDISDPIEREVDSEVALLIANDIKRFGGGKVSGTVKPLEVLSDEALRTAKMELALELSMNAGEDTKKFHEEFGTAWTNLHGSSTLPGLDGYEEDEIDEHQLLVEAFNSAQDKIVEIAQQANKIEKKLTTHHGGYTKRSTLLRQKIVDASAALEKAKMNLDSTRTMQYSEESAIGRRLEGLRGEVSFVSKRERETQDLYRTRKDELDGLQQPVNGLH
jgi:pre-mRNA-splicing factor CDC5/CEF1